MQQTQMEIWFLFKTENKQQRFSDSPQMSPYGCCESSTFRSADLMFYNEDDVHLSSCVVSDDYI